MSQIDQREDWLSRIDAALASLKREPATMGRNESDSKRARYESEGSSSSSQR